MATVGVKGLSGIHFSQCDLTQSGYRERQGA